ncbi:TIGR01777 family protein [Ancylomarina salipaludis]|uniref:TIGR01777 family protein n=1 Tax=Ancylomarina salipaludis TaxID=2501299 RepID=A0A4Q1JIM5_9BACT|nr:TIGR01777 family oxidoreductase [Ancylomarina salipaludis]RXQ89066.1 TIGR01777 family protein [Ancylomarina salipaludis]
MVQVLISGGTGLVGKALCNKLQAKAYDVAILSRHKNTNSPYKCFYWNPNEDKIDSEAIASSDYIIHLAGANIAEKRWTPQRKKIILESRIQSAKLIFDEVQKQQKNLKAFISASAVGYYGSITSEQIFSEGDKAANDFLGRTCQQWEEAANQFNELGIRTTILRTGLVLNKQGGALSKMIIPVKLGLASALGNGKQYLPWIHIDDLCEIYIKAIEDNTMKGAYNAVAPEHQTNLSFTQTLAQVLKKPFWFPNIPTFLIKSLLGEMSELLLTGSRISASKLLSTGFTYKFPKLDKALVNLLEKD